MLIGDLVGFGGPFLKGLDRSIAHEVVAANGTILVVQIELVVDERVVEVDGFGIGLRKRLRKL